ncbi:MAG: hypothetical protein Q9217_006345 [Psora testacea]
MEIEVKEMGTGRLRAPEAFEIPSSVRQTLQVGTRGAKVYLNRRRSDVQVNLIAIGAADDASDDMSNDEFARLRGKPAPSFRVPPWPKPRRECTTSSSSSIGAGGSQGKRLDIFLTGVQTFRPNIFTGNPVILEDDNAIVAENDAFAEATNVKPEVGPVHTFIPQSREELKTLVCVDALTALDPPFEYLDQPISCPAPLPHHASRRVVREDDHGPEPVASPPSAVTLPLPQQSEARASLFEEEEWEVRRIVGKRRVGNSLDIRCGGRIPGCPGASWGTLRNCYKNLRHKV